MIIKLVYPKIIGIASNSCTKSKGTLMILMETFLAPCDLYHYNERLARNISKLTGLVFRGNQTANYSNFGIK